MEKQFRICGDCMDTVAEFKAGIRSNPTAVAMPFPLPLKEPPGQPRCAVCEKGHPPATHKVWFNVAKYDETTYQPIKEGT